MTKCGFCGTSILFGGQQAGELRFVCLLVGWWGFPWGLIITPVQIGRNLAGMMRSPEDKTPPPALERIVRTTLVAQALRPQPRS
jgi:hypothetical protein